MTGAEFDGGVDVDLLADYIGGALTGTPDESVVASRVADDPAWRDAHRELSTAMSAVGAELGRLAPEPMPADLAARLDTLLTAPAPPAPRLTVVPGDEVAPAARVSRKRRLRWATPIAIAAGVAAFAGFGLDYLAGRESASDNSVMSTADSAAREAGAPAAGSAGVAILDTGTDYSATTLGTDPAAQTLVAPGDSKQPVLGAPDTASQGGSRSSSRDDPLSRLRPRDALQECLDFIQAENGAGPIQVLSVDYARYNGNPAVVVRFTAQNGALAWASGPACGTPSRGADTLSKAPVR